jgi:hypothetical protein
MKQQSTQIGLLSSDRKLCDTRGSLTCTLLNACASPCTLQILAHTSQALMILPQKWSSPACLFQSAGAAFPSVRCTGLQIHNWCAWDSCLSALNLLVGSLFIVCIFGWLPPATAHIGTKCCGPAEDIAHRQAMKLLVRSLFGLFITEVGYLLCSFRSLGIRFVRMGQLPFRFSTFTGAASSLCVYGAAPCMLCSLRRLAIRLIPVGQSSTSLYITYKPGVRT